MLKLKERAITVWARSNEDDFLQVEGSYLSLCCNSSKVSFRYIKYWFHIWFNILWIRGVQFHYNLHWQAFFRPQNGLYEWITLLTLCQQEVGVTTFLPLEEVYMHHDEVRLYERAIAWAVYLLFTRSTVHVQQWHWLLCKQNFNQGLLHWYQCLDQSANSMLQYAPVPFCIRLV